MQYLINKDYHTYMLYDELQAYILDKDTDVTNLITNSNIILSVIEHYHQYGENHYENRSG